MQKDIFSRAFEIILVQKIAKFKEQLKDNKQGAHVSVIYTPGRVDYISFGVGYCYISELWVFGDTSEQIVTIVPTPLFYYPLSSGNCEGKEIIN